MRTNEGRTLYLCTKFEVHIFIRSRNNDGVQNCEIGSHMPPHVRVKTVQAVSVYQI